VSAFEILAAVLGGALLVLIAVLLIRAARFTPRPSEDGPAANVEYDAAAAGEHLGAMIRCRTISNRDESLMDFAEYDRFVQLLSELYPAAMEKLHFERAGKTGLIYRWQGTGAAEPVVLMAHYDVVPAKAEEWSFDPFSGQVQDGLVLGRGALDTKSTLCAIFEAVNKLCAEGYTPERDYYLCFSGTEEIAGEGAYAIVDKLKKDGVKPCLTVDEGGAIVTGAFPGVKEPCAVVGISEKGQMAIRLSVKSGAGHASAPPRNDAFSQLARAIAALEKNPFQPRMTEAAYRLFTTLGRYSGFGLRVVFGNLWLFRPLLLKLARALGNDVNALLRTTCVFTMAGGSEASNVLPSEAWATCDVRIIGGSTSQDVINHFRKVIANENVIIEPVFAVEPSPVSPVDCAQWEAVSRAIRHTWPDALVSPYLMTARSDSSVYTAICDHVYRFAPMKLSKEERATIHGIDEKIPAQKVAEAACFYERLIRGM